MTTLEPPPAEPKSTSRPWWRPTRRDTYWFIAGAVSIIVFAVAIAPPTPKCKETAAAPTPVQLPTAVTPPPSAAPPPTVPMPDLIGKTYTAGSAEIVSLKIFAQVDIQEISAGLCTETPTSSLPIVRTDPVAGAPLARNGVKVTLFVDRTAGRPCAPSPAPTTIVAPPGNTYINPPNINLPNPNLPNLNPCKYTKWC